MTRWVFEHGLKHTAPGEGPRLRLTFHEGGRILLEHVDANDEGSLRGELELRPEEAAYLDEVLAPAHLLTLGRSVGTGPSWARVSFEHEGSPREMVILHRTPEGVLDATHVVGLAKAAQPILHIMLYHLARFSDARSSEGPDDITEARGRPIATECTYGKLLMRFTIVDETRHDRMWLKVFETGAGERRLLASDETDGEPMSEAALQLGTGRVAELFELVKRHVPKGTPTGSASAIWELYGTSGKRDVRVVPLEGGLPSRTGAPARVAAVHEAFLAFEALLSRRSPH
ncbi:MAG: hypothetical protein U0174_01045 [Polyangiaceae bacterium]